MPIVPDSSVASLLDRYDVFLLDAYGVLVTSHGSLDGAGAFLRRLEAAGKRWLIVTNDASRSIESSVERYSGFGLPVDAAHVLTSGALLSGYFEREGLQGARCVVLGTDDSRGYVRDAGGVLVEPDDDDAEVCVVCGVTDDTSWPYVPTINRLITMLLRRIGNGRPMRFILPNPDIVYPSDTEAFAFTAGGVAAMLEAVIALRDPARTHRFEPLGKPYAPMFDEAFARVGPAERSRIVMVGDQFVTDIQGAVNAGIDSVLIETGVGQRADLATAPARPTWLLRDLRS
jgi:HAD superfamily hydrolase (TIGR01450 family)